MRDILYRLRWVWAVLIIGVTVCCGRDAAVSSAAPKETTQTPVASTAPQLSFVEMVTGGGDPEKPLPLIIAVHGLGDRPENFESLFSSLPMAARVILPRGPASWYGGYTWFDVALPFSGNQPRLAEGIAAAANRVAALIPHVATTRPTSGKPVITGFSQGGMIAFALAARHPALVALSVPVSGALPDAISPKKGSRLPPIRALHGDADHVVPVAEAVKTVSRLVGAGADATLERFPNVPHTVSVEMRRRLFQYLRDGLGGKEHEQ